MSKELDLDDVAAQSPLATKELSELRSRLCAAEGLLRDAVPYAEWHDKHIHPYLGETFQVWTLDIHLPVPLSETDKSPGKALDRLLEGAKK